MDQPLPEPKNWKALNILGRCTCGKCSKQPPEYAWELHPCPYKSDINDDPDTLCNCCPYCVSECAADI